jgi:transcriptional/translational regulatory protein YebC/TACO1
MAGHSKFKNIMHRKGAQDKKRSAQFSKLSREITVAAKMGMPDPDMNPRLRAAVNAAKAQSMPKDNIQRAIDKATKGEGENYEEIRYEGYGPGGVALIVEALTDNRNRTATNVRTAFRQERRQPGRIGSGQPRLRTAGPDRISRPRRATRRKSSKPRSKPAPTMSKAMGEDGTHAIWTSIEKLHEVARELEKVLGEAEAVKLAWKPSLKAEVGEDEARTLLKLIDVLDDDDDVQAVWGNYEISDEVMEKLG